jgi:hypothetical protein
MNEFTNELLQQYLNYDDNKDFVVADGPEKQEVIGIIESLIAQMGDHTSNVFKTPRGALLCYPWDLLGLPVPRENEKWSVSFRAKKESFVLAYDTQGGLRGHLYSRKAEILEAIRGFRGVVVVPNMADADLPFPVLIAERQGPEK